MTISIKSYNPITTSFHKPFPQHMWEIGLGAIFPEQKALIRLFCFQQVSDKPQL